MNNEEIWDGLANYTAKLYAEKESEKAKEIPDTERIYTLNTVLIFLYDALENLECNLIYDTENKMPIL